MPRLSEQIGQWDNAAIGAFMLWHFLKGLKQHEHQDLHSGILAFVAMGIMRNRNAFSCISNHRKNLQSYARGFEEKNNTDTLIKIHENIKMSMQDTINAIDCGIASGFFTLDHSTGNIIMQDCIKKPRRGSNPKLDITRIAAKAETLGTWFSEHTTSEICKYLKVVL